MTQYFKDIGPQIMPRESTHSGVKAWIWIQSQTGCFFDGIPAFLYHFYTFAATLLFWLTVWSGQFADGPNEGGRGEGRVLDQIVKSSCKFALVRSHGDCWIWKFALAHKITEKNFHNGKKKWWKLLREELLATSKKADGYKRTLCQLMEHSNITGFDIQYTELWEKFSS